MSQVALYDLETFERLFEFDADTSESRSGTVKWTDKPVEDGANISDFGYQPPETFKLEGIVSAWAMDGTIASAYRVTMADAELRRLRDARQLVGLLTKWWGAAVVITNAEAKQAKGDGESLRISLECQTIRLPSAQYTQVPPSRLKSTVRKRSTPRPETGSAAGGKGVAPSWASQLASRARSFFGL